MEDDLQIAAKAWSVENETIEYINARIHDGVAESQLSDRADGYIKTLFNYFPQLNFGAGHVMEIGSGVGFIMEAANRYAIGNGPEISLTGLDISQSMIDAAKSRLQEAHGVVPPNLNFMLYDGVTVPLLDNSLDLIYSVASLQHIPKPFVYNLFFEMRRLIKPSGFAAFHVLSFDALKDQEAGWPWRREISQQIGTSPSGHWHHFYSKDELLNVLRYGTGFENVQIEPTENSLWVCVSKSTATPKAWGWKSIFKRS